MRLVLLVFIVYAVALSVALGRRGIRGPRGARPAGPVDRPARVLIVGATGGTGRELVGQALERGHLVTALVRNPSSLAVAHPRLRIVRGNVLDPAIVSAAVREQDAVVSALGHKQFFRPTRILSNGTRNILRAMEEHHVRRFVCETSLGIGDSAGRMGLSYTFFVVPVILPFYFWDKARQERAIAESRVEWIVVRPGVLTNAAKRGRYRIGIVGSFLRTVRISRADVADFMLNQMTDSTYLGTAAGVCW